MNQCSGPVPGSRVVPRDPSANGPSNSNFEKEDRVSVPGLSCGKSDK